MTGQVNEGHKCMCMQGTGQVRKREEGAEEGERKRKRGKGSMNSGFMPETAGISYLRPHRTNCSFCNNRMNMANHLEFSSLYFLFFFSRQHLYLLFCAYFFFTELAFSSTEFTWKRH